MKKWHVNLKGNPGICTAKISCPYGDLDRRHYDSPEEARKAYELMQDSVENFSQKMSSIIKSITEKEYFEDYSGEQKFQFFLEDKTRELAESFLGFGNVLFFEMNVSKRRAISGFSGTVNIEDKQFWRDFGESFLENIIKYREDSSEPQKFPKSFQIHSGTKPIGSIEDAKKLAKLLEENPDPSLDCLIETNYENMKDKFENEGFHFLGSGAYQIAFEKNGVIWKVESDNILEEDKGNYVLESISSKELFPKIPGVRHVDVSGYVFGNIGIVAQEKVEIVDNPRSLTLRETMTLVFSGHKDHSSSNCGMVGDDLVFFDSFLGSHVFLDSPRAKIQKI